MMEKITSMTVTTTGEYMVSNNRPHLEFASYRHLLSLLCRLQVITTAIAGEILWEKR